MIRLMVGAPENSGIKQAGAKFPVNKYKVNQVAGLRPITIPIPGKLMDGLVLEPSVGNNQIMASTEVVHRSHSAHWGHRDRLLNSIGLIWNQLLH